MPAERLSNDVSARQFCKARPPAPRAHCAQYSNQSFSFQGFWPFIGLLLSESDAVAPFFMSCLAMPPFFVPLSLDIAS